MCILNKFILFECVFQICLLLNTRFLELYQHHSSRIINIYYQTNQTVVATSELVNKSRMNVSIKQNASVQKQYPPYSDESLVKWEAPPKPLSHSSEPGYLG